MCMISYILRNENEQELIKVRDRNTYGARKFYKLKDCFSTFHVNNTLRATCCKSEFAYFIILIT